MILSNAHDYPNMQIVIVEGEDKRMVAVSGIEPLTYGL